MLKRIPLRIVVKINRPLTPYVRRVSPSWPSVAHTKGRKLPLCLECERSKCVCDVGSNSSLSLCSEDDKKADFGETDHCNWSFISDDGEALGGTGVQNHEENGSFLGESSGEVRGDIAFKTIRSAEDGMPSSSTPYRDLGGNQALDGTDEDQEKKGALPTSPPRQNWNPHPPITDKEIFVEEFTGSLQASASPELTAFTVRAKEDVVIFPQKSVLVPTDVILHPPAPHAASQRMTPAVSFCPLSPSSIDLTEGSKLACVQGGSVSVFEQKRLTVSCGNPSTYINVFFPRGTIIGVLEIFPHRY